MLNNIGLPGLLLIAVVVLVLFGRGKVSSLMGEVGKGITAFKHGVKDGEDEVRRGAGDARLSNDRPIDRPLDRPLDRALDRTADDVQAAADRARARADEHLRDVTPRSEPRVESGLGTLPRHDTTPRS